MQEQYGTLKTLRLVAERNNLEYVLCHAELTEEEQSYAKRRLATVEDEMLQLLTADLPK